MNTSKRARYLWQLPFGNRRAVEGTRAMIWQFETRHETLAAPAKVAKSRPINLLIGDYGRADND